MRESRDRLGAVPSLTDELREERVVVRRYRVPTVDVGVESHTGAARRMERLDLARGRLEVARGVFRVDPHLDDVPAEWRNLEHRQRLARGNADLFLHEIDAGEHLGHWVLHLDAGVHLHEVVRPIGVEQHLDRPGPHVIDRLRASDGRGPHFLAQVGGHRGAGCLLDQLLMPPLDGAVTLAEVNDVAVFVAEDLELDVARPCEILLDVDVAVAERGERLRARGGRSARIVGRRARRACPFPPRRRPP